ALRCRSGRPPPRLAARQKSASRLRASSRPPRASPSARITALTAPAEAPVMTFDLEPPVVEQVIEHAPAEGAERATALQREIDALGRGRRRRIAANGANDGFNHWSPPLRALTARPSRRRSNRPSR